MKPRLIIIFSALLFLAQANSCTIEKRRYMNGFHVEKLFGELKRNNATVDSQLEEKKHERDVIFVDGCTSNNDTYIVEKIESAAPVKSFITPKPISVKRIPSTINGATKSFEIAPEIESYASPLKSSRSIHPDAFTSFLFGILSLGCLAAIFITAIGSLLVFVSLLLVMLFFAFLAGKLAKRAFKDMHYAHDRYSGKGLAAAGLVMGVLSIVAFIGLVLIVILGIAFVTFT